MHPDIGRQRPRQARNACPAAAAQASLGQIRVRRLATRVHSRVGTAGDGEPRRLWEPQHPLETLCEHAFHGAAARLRRPPGKSRPVIGKINFYPNGQRFLPRVRSGRPGGTATGG